MSAVTVIMSAVTRMIRVLTVVMSVKIQLNGRDHCSHFFYFEYVLLIVALKLSRINWPLKLKIKNFRHSPKLVHSCENWTRPVGFLDRYFSKEFQMLHCRQRVVVFLLVLVHGLSFRHTLEDETKIDDNNKRDKLSPSDREYLKKIDDAIGAHDFNNWALSSRLARRRK